MSPRRPIFILLLCVDIISSSIMKILEHNEGLLTNSEIRTILLEKSADQREMMTARPAEKKVYEYLTLQGRHGVTAARIQSVKERAQKEFGLTEAEALQLVNLQPDSELEMPLIIEQCEERLSEEQIEQLVAWLKEALS